ncbi:MAG: helix-turn-helix transcriptional regulator [Bacillota bacterium]
MEMWKDVIENEMKKRNITLRKLAELTGYSYEYLRVLFKGKQRFHQENIERIGKALGVNFELYPCEESPPRPPDEPEIKD